MRGLRCACPMVTARLKLRLAWSCTMWRTRRGETRMRRLARCALPLLLRCLFRCMSPGFVCHPRPCAQMPVVKKSMIDTPRAFNYFMSKREVARWVAKCETLTKAELKFCGERTMPGYLAFLGSPADVNRLLRRMPDEERELLLRDGEIILDFYDAPGVYTRMRMRGRRSRKVRAEIVAVERGLRAECE